MLTPLPLCAFYAVWLTRPHPCVSFRLKLVLLRPLVEQLLHPHPPDRFTLFDRRKGTPPYKIRLGVPPPLVLGLCWTPMHGLQGLTTTRIWPHPWPLTHPGSPFISPD